MKRKILVAYDGSDLSHEALNEAKLQAKGVPETEVYVLAVVTQAGPATNATAASSFEKEIADKFHTKMEKIKSDFEQSNITVYTDVTIDVDKRNAGEQICSYALEHQADLIIVGSRGLGDVKKLFLGSVSNRVVELSQCPVLIIK
ncbi:universal stress protein [Barrientosiimonas marina]|uniref:Universal stress protein n=1 Tax=Lentibacillus kimchii TaxID=1542911 RepID=A0ABW2UR35_9BACI